MKYRTRIYYSDAQKALMWDRWKEGESLHSVAGLFDRGPQNTFRPLVRLRGSANGSTYGRMQIGAGYI